MVKLGISRRNHRQNFNPRDYVVRNAKHWERGTVLQHNPTSATVAISYPTSPIKWPTVNVIRGARGSVLSHVGTLGWPK